MSKPGFADGVEAQPANLAEAAAGLREALSARDLAPLREGTVVFSGIGASWHALEPSVRRLQAAGRRAFAVPAAQLAGARGLADAYVLVSQSGRSVEILEVLDTLPADRVVGLSAHADSPLASAAGTFLPLSVREDSAVSTLSYTATLQALGMLAEELLAGPRTDWARVADLVAGSLARHREDAAALGEQLAQARALDAIAAAGSLASAGESALLAREGLHLPADGEETRQYLHGPLEAVGAGFCCLLFGAAREVELASSLAAWGANAWTVTAGEAAPAGDGVRAISIESAGDLAGPILEIVPVQMAVAAAAERLGLGLGELERQQPDTKIAGAA
jgi:glucosamine--fructose-6-phosphate aminotransferase (isomerizing)